MRKALTQSKGRTALLAGAVGVGLVAAARAVRRRRPISLQDRVVLISSQSE